MKKFTILLAAVALVVAACSGTDGATEAVGEAPVVAVAGDTHEDDDVDRTVAVTLSEFDFFFGGDSTLAVETGETVQFVVTNAGVAEHEFRLTTTDEAIEHVENGHEDHMNTDSDMYEEVLLLVGSGETATINVTFGETGEYSVVACLIPGHYEAGMSRPVQYS